MRFSFYDRSVFPSFRLSSLLPAALVVGCSTDAVNTQTAAIADSAGITIVTNTAPASTAGNAWRVADHPTIDIGVVSGDAAYEFFRPLGAVRLSDGRIVVANRGTFELRYFDAGGKHLLTAGGEGAGPGELMDMSWFTRTVGDSMVVYDRRNHRLSVFDPQGVYDHSVRLQTSEFPFMKGRLEDGSYVGHLWRRRQRGAPPIPAGRGTDSLWVVRYGTDGHMLDTLGTYLRRVRHGNTLDWRGRTIRSAVAVPFTPITATYVSGDLTFTGTNNVYEIAAQATDGRVRRLVRKVHTKLPVLHTDTERFMDSVRILAVGNPEMQWVVAMLDITPPQDSMPAYEEFTVDSEGNLWVADARRPNTPTPSWNVFDREGVWLGRVEGPTGFRVTEIGGDYVLGLWRDEVEVEHVMLYALEKG
ncbi:MAG: hypothetical protein V3T56_05195 [Gemmatimonadales bacterium]